MKKSILALSLTALFFSCKKESKTDFTATDVTGTAILNGYVTRQVIIPNGSGNWTTGTIPAAGVNVTGKTNRGGNGGLYPQASANSGADLYSATTDANGRFALNVKANAQGVSLWYTISGFTGTQDTIINGNTKTGLYCNFWGTTNNQTMYMGQTRFMQYNLNASNFSSNPNNIQIGQATLTGSVGMNLVLSTAPDATTAPVYGNTIMPVPAGIVVYMSLNKDPETLAPRIYSTTTNSSGGYTFSNFNTVANGTSGFSQNANIWVDDYVATRDTHIVVNSVIVNAAKTGLPGVYQSNNTNQNGLFTNEYRNAVNLTYNSFTAN